MVLGMSTSCITLTSIECHWKKCQQQLLAADLYASISSSPGQHGMPPAGVRISEVDHVLGCLWYTYCWVNFITTEPCSAEPWESFRSVNYCNVPRYGRKSYCYIQHTLGEMKHDEPPVPQSLFQFLLLWRKGYQAESIQNRSVWLWSESFPVGIQCSNRSQPPNIFL